ncbi:MAG: YIP1 family protein [Desulfatiglandaceae bacterium]
MSAQENVMVGSGNQRKTAFFHGFIRTLSAMLHPGDFYEGWARRNGNASPPAFLFMCSILFTIPSSIFVVEKRMVFALMFFLNAFCMPFIASFVLYIVTFLFCKNAFSYNKLFGITAYANVTLLISWIPGLAGPSEILKLFLIGLGMVKIGRISRLRSVMCLVAAAALLLLLVHCAQPVWCE